MSNKEKPNFLHIAIKAFITTITSLAITICVQWISMENVVITVSPSLKLDEKYLTVISVQNLKKKTLSGISLYFDTDFDVLEIKSENNFEHNKQYVELESISPKAKYSVIIWTKQSISKGQIIVESDYKTRLDYSKDTSPFLLQMIWIFIIFGLITFAGTGFHIWLDWKQRIKESQKILEKCNELNEENEKNRAELQAQKEKMETMQKIAEQSSIEYERRQESAKKDLRELRSYFITQNSQLRKELSFWRDTIRKLLYASKNEFQTADKIIDIVTSTLRTYTTREGSDENMDELLYLAQLIADSRELHNKHRCSDYGEDM